MGDTLRTPLLRLSPPTRPLPLPTLLLPLLTPLLLLLRLRPSTTSCKSAKQSRQDHVRNSRQTIACTPYLLRNLFNYLFGFEINILETKKKKKKKKKKKSTCVDTTA